MYDKLIGALHACAGDTTAAEHAETVNGAANLTARDWIQRALHTLRCINEGDSHSDIIDDLTHAIRRMDVARDALKTDISLRLDDHLHVAELALTRHLMVTDGDGLSEWARFEMTAARDKLNVLGEHIADTPERYGVSP